MVRKILLTASVLLPFAAAACGDNGAGTSGSGGTGTGTSSSGTGASGAALPCDVDAVLAQNCRQCHSSPPKFGAPMPLVTYEDLHANAKSDSAKKVYEVVGQRIHDTKLPMPQPPNPPLDAESLAIMDGWIAAGGPEGGGNCGGTGGAGGAGGGGSLNCVPDTQIRATAAYSMPQNVTDAYVCFGVDVNSAEKRHITTIAPAVDNATIVHHMLLFEADQTYSSTPQPCGGFSAGWRLISVWAPGGEPLVLPDAAGFPIEGTSHYVVQVHYSNLMQLSGQTDSSGFDMCTTTTLRANDADIMAFGTTKINVPAHGSQDLTCDLKVPAGLQPVTVFKGMPHMHLLGQVISATNLPGGNGPGVDLGTRDPWDFNTQYWDSLETQISSGDTVRVRCFWENPGNSNVGFGEKTSDEMCFSFVAYYPRIQIPNWTWSLPALSSTCAPTP